MKTNCEYCGPICYEGAAHFARIEDNVRYVEDKIAPLPPKKSDTKFEEWWAKSGCSGHSKGDAYLSWNAAFATKAVPIGEGELPELDEQAKMRLKIEGESITSARAYKIELHCRERQLLQSQQRIKELEDKLSRFQFPDTSGQ